LMFLIAAAYSVTVYLAHKRIDLWAFLSAICGVAAGLVVNPYFPNNITLFIEHLLMKMTGKYSVDVGVEWYPYETWVILVSSAVAFAIYLAALIAFDFRKRSQDIKPLFFLIVSAALLVMAFKSRRFIEYWPPFAIIFAAFTMSSAGAGAIRSWCLRARDRAIAFIAAAGAPGAFGGGVTAELFG